MGGGSGFYPGVPTNYDQGVIYAACCRDGRFCQDTEFPHRRRGLTQRLARSADYKVIHRKPLVVGFEPPKISVAMTKAFLAVNGGAGAASARVREQVARLTEAVVQALVRRQP